MTVWPDSMSRASVPEHLEMDIKPQFDHGKGPVPRDKKSKARSRDKSESELSCERKIADKSCPPWAICILGCLGSYALWLAEGNDRVLYTKFVTSHLLSGGLGVGGTYLSVFHLYPSTYAVCIGKEDQELYAEYKLWFEDHRRTKAESWTMMNQSYPGPPILPNSAHHRPASRHRRQGGKGSS